MPNAKKYKLLLVEDEKMIARAYQKGFTQAGFDIVIASDGGEGFQKAQEYRPDLVLLDLIMPGVDGLTFLRNLRGSDWGKDTSVFVLTNSSDAERADEAKHLGIDAFLLKSDWSMEQLIEKIRTHLARIKPS